jgi:hypothetical protein
VERFDHEPFAKIEAVRAGSVHTTVEMKVAAAVRFGLDFEPVEQLTSETG